MILQKLAQAIRRQDWFQVTIEVLIVVVGIFLGLQVTDWSDEQVIIAEEEEYLNRLHNDITISISINEEGIRFMREQIRFARLLTETLKTCELSAEDKPDFVLGMYQIGYRATPNFTQNSLEELRSTGKFQYISNVELRDALVTHSEAMESASRIDELLTQRLTPHIITIENYNTYRIADDTILEETLSSGFDGMTGEEMDINMDELCENEKVIRSISLLNVRNFSELIRISETIGHQNEIKRLIEKEMSRFN
jgi:hypothetical protein